MKELWKCSKCGSEYRSPIAILGMTCSTPKCSGTMKRTNLPLTPAEKKADL